MVDKFPFFEAVQLRMNKTFHKPLRDLFKIYPLGFGEGQTCFRLKRSRKKPCFLFKLVPPNTLLYNALRPRCTCL